MRIRSRGVATWLIGCSALALAGQAEAQATPQQTAPEAPPEDAAATPLSGVASEGEVIVTAQRREQRLQDVPLSIDVVSVEDFDRSNLTTIADIQYLSPGVNYNSNFGGGFNVRGVGTQSLLITAEQSVALVIDDVIQGLPEVSFAGPSYQSLGDLDRIEVLRGPQGTLFGKNSSAGVIQIVTRRPELGISSVDASVSYGSYSELNTSATVNLPIGDRVALRVSGNLQHRDGFVNNLLTGEDHWGYDRQTLRARLLWEPTANLSVLLSGTYQHAEDNANGLWTLRVCGSGSGAFNPCDTVRPLGVVPGPRNLDVAVEGPNFTDQDSYTLSGRIDWDLGGPTLTSITAFRHLDQNIGVDTDGTQRPIYSLNTNFSGGDQFTQELRLAGRASIFEYTLGAFYYHATPYQIGINGGTLGLLPDSSPILLNTTSIGPFANSGGAVDVSATVESWALFGQLEAQVTPELRLIAGARYTNDNVRQEIFYFATDFLCRAAYASGASCFSQSMPTPVDVARTDADRLTYKLTAQYAFSPDFNIYVSYATGYKGPMISYPANQPQLPLLPETSESWEAGLRAQMFQRRLAVNLSVFQVDYDNFQGQQRVGSPPIFYYTTTNAGGLRTRGVEFDAAWRVQPWLTLSGNVSYIPTEFTEFAVQCFDLYANPATPPGECNYLRPGTPPGAPFQFNAAGYPLIYSPKWTYAITGDVNVPVGNNLEVGAHATYSWRSRTYGLVADLNSINPGYGLMNVEVGVGSADGRWRVSAFARNLFDKYFVAGIFRSPLDAGAANSTPLSTIGYSNIPALDSSRTIGVKLQISFGR